MVVLRQRLTEGESRESPIEGEAESEKVDQAVPLGPGLVWGPPMWIPGDFNGKKHVGTQPEVGILL